MHLAFTSEQDACAMSCAPTSPALMTPERRADLTSGGG